MSVIFKWIWPNRPHCNPHRVRHMCRMAELIIRRGLAEPDTSGQFVPHKPMRPDKPDGGKRFTIVSEYQPAGDQPTAIADLVKEEDEILAEDLLILERYRHRYIHLDNRREMHTKADRLSLAWRNLMKEAIAAS